MAKKKRTKKRKSRRNVKRIGSRSAGIKKKIAVVIKNLLLFIALSLVSLVLSRFLQNDFFIKLFFVMAIIFGFVAVGFLISLVILAIMKTVSKK